MFLTMMSSPFGKTPAGASVDLIIGPGPALRQNPSATGLYFAEGIFFCAKREIGRKTGQKTAPYGILDIKGGMSMPQEISRRLEENPFLKLNDAVYEHLRDQIIALRLEPGTRLVESQLAQAMQVSRSPVKAALLRLEGEQLVQQEPGKSPIVAPIRYEDCLQLLEARRGIEGQAAYLAAERITDRELEKLKQALLDLKQADQKGDPAQCAESDARFHQLVINASRNQYLADSFALLRGNISRYLLYVLRRMEPEGLGEYEHHRGVYHALKNRCGSLARDEMIRSVEHMYHAMRYL